MKLETMFVCAAALFVSCGATPNPERPERAGASVTTPPRPEPTNAASTAQSSAAGTAAGTAAPRTEQAVARVGGEPISVTELVLHWVQQSPREVRATLEQLVDSKMVVAEADRLGITVDPERIEALYQETLADLQQNVEQSYPDMSLEDWIVGRLGLAPEFYLGQARTDVVRHLLAERTVRAFTLANERATVRAVVTGERARAEEALARAQTGEDFATIAKELSQDSSAERGGLLPPVLRSGSTLSRLAFSTGAGKLGGPIQEQQSWLVMRVESIDPPLRGRWDEVRDTVEASLSERPVQDAEYWQWRVEMLERYDVDLSPFIDLTGGRRR